jgi:tRNA A37 threonylcarbamoyladenosine modification protein TsaB
MRRWSAAIDYSGDHLAISIGQTGSATSLLDTATELSGPGSSEAFRLLEDTLGKTGACFQDITHWTIGLGPGNFSRLRLISSLISGLTVGAAGTAARGIPSAIAVAAELNPPCGQIIAVLFQGRNETDLVIASAVRTGQNEFRRGNNRTTHGTESLANTLHEQGVASVVAVRWRGELPELGGLPFHSFSEFPVKQLRSVNPDDWRNESLHELEYARPPVQREKIA